MHRAAVTLALAPTVANFSLTRIIRRQRSRKMVMKAAERRTTAAAERRRGRRRGEVLTGTF